jgi:two-component sensor histidine kinase
MQGEFLLLTWEESGGPLVHKPTSRGFGTRSVIASIESQLGGQALFDWRSEGLICRLLVPLMRQTATSELDDRHDVAASNTVLRRVSGSAGS